MISAYIAMQRFLHVMSKNEEFVNTMEKRMIKEWYYALTINDGLMCSFSTRMQP